MSSDIESIAYNDDLHTYEVIIRSSVAIIVEARDLDEVMHRWQDVLASEPDYIENLFDNAEVYRVEQQD